ncbi:MAG: hypothetical protein PVG30_00645 [Gammaproteobacteria bacterium]|jgi:hypothetical protein
MDNTFILNPSATILNLRDAIDERLMKAKSIATCLLSQDQTHYASSYAPLHGAIWAINDYLDEIEYFEEKIKEREK